MELLATSAFWVGLVQIVWINLILSGDNAVVIALAARSLPPPQQRRAVLLGSGAAVALRLALTLVAAWLLQLPWLQIVGGLLLLWIGIHLLAGGAQRADQQKTEGTRGGMLAAVRTILLADLIMSLDNVIAVAAVASSSVVLLILGLAISIPLVIFGSALMIWLVQRFAWIVVLGAALIGWVAGVTISKDAALHNLTVGQPWLRYAAAAAGAALVVAIGKALAARTRRAAVGCGNASNSV